MYYNLECSQQGESLSELLTHSRAYSDQHPNNFNPFDRTFISGLLKYDLVDLLTGLGDAAQKHKNIQGVLITIDEMHYLADLELATLCHALGVTRKLGLPIMVCGAGFPHLKSLLAQANQGKQGASLFSEARIGNLGKASAKEALRRPAATEGVTWSEDATNFIADQTEGYPYFIQEFGYKTWNVASASKDDLIGLYDAESATKQLLGENGNITRFLRRRFNSLSEIQKQYVLAMVSLGTGPYEPRDVREALGWLPSKASEVLDNLKVRGYCSTTFWGDVDFSIPLFYEQLLKDFLGDKYPESFVNNTVDFVPSTYEGLSSANMVRRCGKRRADGKACRRILKSGSRCPHHP